MRRGSIVKRPSGLFGIRYYANGKRRYETIGPNRRDAERALTARLAELDQGKWREPTDVTLAEYARRWLDLRNPALSTDRKTGIAPSTFAEYRQALELHVLPTLGRRLLSSLTSADVDELVVAMQRSGKAAGTVRNTITPLRKLLGDAERQGLVRANVASKADLPPAQDFVGKELPPEDAVKIRQALVELAQPNPLRGGEADLFYAWMFDVAIGGGFRLGELRALRCRDIDHERKLIRVERAYSRGEVRGPKTEAGKRRVPLFPSVDAALKQLAARALERGRYAPDELVFAREHGTPLHPSNFNRRVWAKALHRAKLGEWTTDSSGRREWHGAYRWHDLRHTCVSQLVAAGADPKLVQAIAWHANPLITLKR
jgi:integrase